MPGIDEVTPHIELEGSDEIIARFNDIATAAEGAFKKIEAAAEKVGGAGEHIRKATEEGKKSLEELGVIGAEAFAKIMDAAASGNFTGVMTMGFGKLAGAITETTQRLSEFIRAQGELIETLSGLASATGMTLPQILGLREAFASVGISTNAFERSIGRLAITIANDWSQIQQAVRTSADQQTAAMLHVKETSEGVTKAYNTMYEALDRSSRGAAHNALGIESAAHSLRSAMQALSDFALSSRSNSLGIESATLALARAKMNLAKDEGYAVSAEEEKGLKIAQDKVAVKEAELRVSEASNKKVKEALEMEDLLLKVKKARQEASDAEHKQLEDSVKATQAIRDAQIGIEKARLAQREASEKQHEGDLKDIPAIAKEIENVVGGYKKWGDVINATEINAQSLTKAIIKAASVNGEKPEALAVFEKMSELFPNLTDKSMKLSIVQHMMGAGFRAGQASAAQLYAVIERGPEQIDRLTQGMESFLKSMGTNELGASIKNLEHFNSSLALVETALDASKTKMLAVLSVPLAEFYRSIRDSLVNTGGSLNTLNTAVIKFLDGIASLAKGIGEVIAKVAGPAWEVLIDVLSRLLTVVGDTANAVGKLASYLTSLLGIKTDAFFTGITYGLIGVAIASDTLVASISKLLLRLAVIPASVGLAVTALGGLVRMVGAALENLPSWLGGGATENTKAIIEAGERIEKYGQTIMRTLAKVAGFSDEVLDKAGKAGPDRGAAAAGITKGIFGDSTELKKLMEEPAHEQKDAAKLQHDAATMQKESAAEINKRLNEKGSDGKSQNDRNQDFFDRKIREMYPNQSAGHDANNAPRAAEEQKAAADEQKGAATEQKQASGQFNTGVSAFDSVVNGMVSGLASLLSKIGAPGTGEGKASGGMIRGPGGARDDRAGLFALSDGEFVVQAAAVSRYGPQLFHALNDLAIGGFAEGGSVGSASGVREITGTGALMRFEDLSRELKNIVAAAEKTARGLTLVGESAVKTGDIIIRYGSRVERAEQIGRMTEADPRGKRATQEPDSQSYSDWMKAKNAQHPDRPPAMLDFSKESPPANPKSMLDFSEKITQAATSVGTFAEAVKIAAKGCAEETAERGRSIQAQRSGRDEQATEGAAEKTEGAAEKTDDAAEKTGGAAEKTDEAASSLASAAEALTAAAQSIGSAGAGEGKAAGGLIHGPGGPTDDKAGLFALSDNEYVVRSAAVSHYGAPLFEALNNLAVGGFATGGIVGPRAPSIPSSPSVGPSSILNLTIDGQHFNGLRAPEHVASKLKTYAVGRQSSSAGKTPSWFQ